MGLHAVAAHDFQLIGNHRPHGNGGQCVVPGHEAHLDVATALAQAEQRVDAGDATTQGVQRKVRPALA